MTNVSDNNNVKKGILFVCYGNTCRSPIAESVMKHLVKKRNLQSQFNIDSAGISDWQKGQAMNDYAKKILQINGIEIINHHARQISVDDFEQFKFIIGMDNYNMQALNNYQNVLGSDNELILLGDYNPIVGDDKIIEDPFFDNKEDDFKKCFQQISQCCENLLEFVLQTNST